MHTPDAPDAHSRHALQTLQTHTPLHGLARSLCDNSIGPTGAKALADALASGRAVLKSLDLSTNALCGIDLNGDGTYDPSGIQALAAALGSGSTVLPLLRAAASSWIPDMSLP